MLLLVRLEKLDLIHFVLFVDHGQKSHPRKKKGKESKIENKKQPLKPRKGCITLLTTELEGLLFKKKKIVVLDVR